MVGLATPAYSTFATAEAVFWPLQWGIGAGSGITGRCRRNQMTVIAAFTYRIPI
jgi:hypothetical protein